MVTEANFTAEWEAVQAIKLTPDQEAVVYRWAHVAAFGTEPWEKGPPIDFRKAFPGVCLTLGKDADLPADGSLT